MRVVTGKIKIDTSGSGDLLNITGKVADMLRSSKLKNGDLTVFVVGSTAAITTFEFEPGLMKDFRELAEKLIPQAQPRHHDDTWGDANGFSHLRSSLFGPSLVVPFEEGRLALGTWQQVVLAEFDNRPRKREVVVQMIGE